MADAAAQAKASALLNLLALGNFTVGMGAFVVIGIITPIADGLQISKADAGIILTAYAIAYAVLSPIGAALTGSLSRRAVLTGALTLFCLGSVLSAVAWSLPILTFSRDPGGLWRGPLHATCRQCGRCHFAAGTTRPGPGQGLWRVDAGAGRWRAAGRLARLSLRLALDLLDSSGPCCRNHCCAVQCHSDRHLSFQTTTFATILSALRNGRLMLAVTFTATIMTAVYIVFTFFGPLIEASAGSNPETRTFYLVLFGIGAVLGNLRRGLSNATASARSAL